MCLCGSSPCLLALRGAPVAHPLLSHPPAPPVRGFHISIRRGLSRARLAGHGPVAAGCSSRPCGVRGHLVEGGGGGVFADGSLGIRRIWWLLQRSHLMVPLCVPLGLVSLPCVGRLCAQLLCCLRSSQFQALSFSSWHAHCCSCAAPGGQHVAPCIPLWLSGCPTCGWVVLGAPGAFAHVSKSTNRPVTGVCGGCSGVNVVHCCSFAFWAAEGLRAVHALERGTRVSPPPVWSCAVNTNRLDVVCHKRAQGPCTRPW